MNSLDFSPKVIDLFCIMCYGFQIVLNINLLSVHNYPELRGREKGTDI